MVSFREARDGVLGIAGRWIRRKTAPGRVSRSGGATFKDAANKGVIGTPRAKV